MDAAFFDPSVVPLALGILCLLGIVASIIQRWDLHDDGQ